MTAVWILSVIFFSVVMSLWMIFHYITKWKQMRQAGAVEGQTVVDRRELLHLREVAASLEERIETLESILDAEVTNWRKK